MSVLVLSEEDLRRILREELRALLADAPRAAAEDRRVTYAEAAATAGVSPATIKAWAREGRLTRYGEGRNTRFSLLEVRSVRPLEKPADKQTPEEWADANFRRRHG